MGHVDLGRRKIPGIVGVRTIGALSLVMGSVVWPQAPASHAPEFIVERVDLQGMRCVSGNTIRERVRTRPGGLFHAEVSERDAQNLRDTGYFKKVTVNFEDSPHRADAKIVVFSVVEDLSKTAAPGGTVCRVLK